MIIVSGAIYVAPAARQTYLDGCRTIVEQARAATGCLDFALSADLLEPDRINVYERWDSAEQLARFRSDGPSGDQQAQILDAQVAEYRVAD